MAAVLRVSDSGEGIAPDALPHVFDLFVQADRQGLARRRGGLGIGLTVVKRLTELHDGAAEAASPGPGLGSTFVVRLPIDVRASREVANESAQAPAFQSPNGKRRIVVIEDNDDARAMLRVALSLDGHEVCEASDGKPGIALADEFKPHLVLLDIGLPDMDGYAVARTLRAKWNGGAALHGLSAPRASRVPSRLLPPKDASAR
jgi:hypothetical protein